MEYYLGVTSIDTVVWIYIALAWKGLDDAADVAECSPLVPTREPLSEVNSIPPLTWSKSDQPLIYMWTSMKWGTQGTMVFNVALI